MLFLRFLFVKLSVWVMNKGRGCKTVEDEPDFTADIRHPTDGMNFIKGNSLRDFHKPQ